MCRKPGFREEHRPTSANGCDFTTCLGVEILVSKLYNFYLHPWDFLSFNFVSPKCHGLPKLKWALDLCTRYPHNKMTYKNPFCSGLKATYSVGETSLGVHWAQSPSDGSITISKRKPHQIPQQQMVATSMNTCVFSFYPWMVVSVYTYPNMRWEVELPSGFLW